MKILIAEDEEHSRSELRFLLEKLEPQSEIIEAENGRLALQFCQLQEPDVVFLDINMPGLSGLLVAEQVLKFERSPLIVFATAYNEHAFKAFDLAALDYLLKPFRESRLKTCLERIRQALSHEAIRLELEERLRNYVFENSPPSVKKLWASKAEGAGVLLDYHEILWFEADGKRVIAQTHRGEALQVRYTIADLEERLRVSGFFRSHKSYLINLEHVREVEPWFSGTYIIRMSNQATVPLSRQYARVLKEQLGWF